MLALVAYSIGAVCGARDISLPRRRFPKDKANLKCHFRWAPALAELANDAKPAHAAAGARRFVRVLQLLGEHPLDRVRRAVEACQLDQAIGAEAIIERTRGLAAIESRIHL